MKVMANGGQKNKNLMIEVVEEEEETEEETEMI